VRFAEAILATKETDVIRVAEDVLAALLNGANALRYLRMFPGSATDSVHDFLRVTSVRRKDKGKQ
jgi:hypothetical protein